MWFTEFTRCEKGIFNKLLDRMHPLDLHDAITIAKLRSMVASTKGSVSGPTAREPF